MDCRNRRTGRSSDEKSQPAPEPVVEIIEVATNDVITPPSLPKDDAPVNDVVDGDPTKNNGNGNGNGNGNANSGSNSNGNGNSDNSANPNTDTQDKPNRFAQLVDYIRDELEERSGSNANNNHGDDDDKPHRGSRPKPRRVN